MVYGLRLETYATIATSPVRQCTDAIRPKKCYLNNAESRNFIADELMDLRDLRAFFSQIVPQTIIIIIRRKARLHNSSSQSQLTGSVRSKARWLYGFPFPSHFPSNVRSFSSAPRLRLPGFGFGRALARRSLPLAVQNITP